MFILTKDNSSFLKGIAILLVVANHVVGKIGQTPGSILGAIGVSVFFILSGYGLYESYKLKGIGKFWGKKIIHIWLPYICISIPMMLINGVSTRVFFEDIFLLKPYYCYGWYLQILALFYIFFYFSLKNKSEILFFAFWVAVTISVYLLLYDVAQINALAFLIGICLSKYRMNIKISKIHILLLSGLFALIGLFAFIFLPVENGMWLPRLQTIQVSMALMLILLTVAFDCNHIILMWIGSISFELYIVHGWIIDPMHSISIITVCWLVPFVILLSWLYSQLWKRVLLKLVDKN